MKLELILKAIVLSVILPMWLYIMYHGIVLQKFTIFNVGGTI